MTRCCFEGKTALVTGSSRGIGRAIAIHMASAGANVIITYHRAQEAANEVAAQIQADLVLRLDVTSADSVNSAFQAIQTQYHHLDILVNNAGLNRPNDFDVQTLDEWNEVIDANLRGVFLCTQAALPLLRSGGRIINIGSVSGQLGGPRSPAYAAAKAGAIGLTHCMARFFAKRQITVNCVSPGIVDNDLTRQTMPPSLRSSRLQNILMGRLGTADEIAEAVCFLCSDGSSFITAHTLNVNGGEWW